MQKCTEPRANQVWQVDITYLRTKIGFMYLVALIDMHSRFVVAARLSNDLATEFCLLNLEDAMAKYGKPDIINSDQGSQFTSDDWISTLQKYGIKISMTGKGRCNDNANIERLWRAFKYEGSYLHQWCEVLQLKENMPIWIKWYNTKRPHQALGYKTPIEVYYHKIYDSKIDCGLMDKLLNLPTTPQSLQLQNDLIL